MELLTIFSKAGWMSDLQKVGHATAVLRNHLESRKRKGWGIVRLQQLLLRLWRTAGRRLGRNAARILGAGVDVGQQRLQQLEVAMLVCGGIGGKAEEGSEAVASGGRSHSGPFKLVFHPATKAILAVATTANPVQGLAFRAYRAPLL